MMIKTPQNHRWCFEKHPETSMSVCLLLYHYTFCRENNAPQFILGKDALGSAAVLTPSLSA